MEWALFVADAAAATDSLRSGISPLLKILASVASIACVFFVVIGAYYYMTSGGNPEKLERAKRTLRNSFIGLLIVVSSASAVGVLQNAYSSKPLDPKPIEIKEQKEKDPFNLTDVVNDQIKKFIKETVESLSKPVIALLKQYTQATPLMAENKSVFNLWLVIVAITDVLFLLVVSLLGFKVMSASVLGFDDVDLRSLVPQIIIAFVVANSSIFVIDLMILLCNAMIQALLMGMSIDIIWASIGTLFTAMASLHTGLLLLVAVVLILGLMLLIYYVLRLVGLYVGAALSPLVVLLWLLPSFRDFSVAATKRYIVTIFVIFVHIAILMVSISFFSSGAQGADDAFLVSLYGIAVLLVMIKTSSFMNQVAFAGSGNTSMRKLGSTFIRSTSHMTSSIKKGITAPGRSAPRQGSFKGGTTSSTHIIKNTSYRNSAGTPNPTPSAAKTVRKDQPVAKSHPKPPRSKS